MKQNKDTKMEPSWKSDIAFINNLSPLTTNKIIKFFLYQKQDVFAIGQILIVELRPFGTWMVFLEFRNGFDLARWTLLINSVGNNPSWHLFAASSAVKFNPYMLESGSTYLHRVLERDQQH